MTPVLDISHNLQLVSTTIMQVGKLIVLREDEDFYQAGLRSIDALNLLMELETVFGVSIPDDRFMAARTTRVVHDMIVALKQEQA